MTIEVPETATVTGCHQAPGHPDQFPPGIDLTKQKVGVFGRLVKPDAALRPGDRVEIYQASSPTRKPCPGAISPTTDLLDWPACPAGFMSAPDFHLPSRTPMSTSSFAPTSTGRALLALGLLLPCRPSRPAACPSVGGILLISSSSRSPCWVALFHNATSTWPFVGLCHHQRLGASSPASRPAPAGEPGPATWGMSG